MISNLISLEYFKKSENSVLYEAYRKLKYKIFVTECGWEALTSDTEPNKAKVDQYDAIGRFLIALNEDQIPIGILRGIALRKGFPHKSLFDRHLANDIVNNMLANMCTLNALAVLPKYRGKIFNYKGLPWTGSVGKIMMLALMQSFEKDQIVATIITAQGQAGAKFFQSLGFKMIDHPIVTDLHPDPLTNMALIFGSTMHLRALEKCNIQPLFLNYKKSEVCYLEEYFDKCESR